jgi:hypothetical protein
MHVETSIFHSVFYGLSFFILLEVERVKTWVGNSGPPPQPPAPAPEGQSAGGNAETKQAATMAAKTAMKAQKHRKTSDHTENRNY